MLTKEDIEILAKDYHEMCREMVEKQIGMITAPTRPYIEWDELTENMKLGRKFIAQELIKKYALLDWQDQFDIVKLRDLINDLIGIDDAIGISMKWLDLKDIFEQL